MKVPIFGNGHSGMVFKKLAKQLRRVKVQFVCYVRNRKILNAAHLFDFCDSELNNFIAQAFTADRSDHAIQIRSVPINRSGQLESAAGNPDAQ